MNVIQEHAQMHACMHSYMSIYTYRPAFGRPESISHTHKDTYILLYTCADQLDQHLEGLQAAGVPDVVRVGGRSKSEKLKTRNIRNVVRIQTANQVCQCYAGDHGLEAQGT